jgi:hypothetical protein
MIVTSMQLTISSRRDIAVLQKESSSLEGQEDVKLDTPRHCVAARYGDPQRAPTRAGRAQRREAQEGRTEFGGGMIVFGAGMCEYKHEA